MKELFFKYLNDQCSPTEVKELLAYFNTPENETILRELIAESLEDMEAENEEHQSKHVTEKLFTAIKTKIKSEKTVVVPLYRKPWIRVAAAAIILLIGGFVTFNFIKKTNVNRDVVNVDASKQVDSSTQNTDPGSNKATLTLADGSIIVLENAVNGTIAKQGGIEIVKSDRQLTYKFSDKEPTEVVFNTITTPRGGQYHVILSDGSKVWLNAASNLRFPAGFSGTERKVELIGEAFFEVAKNVSMPFKVKIEGRSEVEVLGTHFNVNAYTDEATVNTTLIEGSVKVTGLSSNESRIIDPGQQAKINNDGQISIHKNVDVEQSLAWKNGTFHFSNANLAMVMRQLSRWYDVDVQFEGSIPERQFSGEIQRDLKLPQVLKLLEKNDVYCRLEGKILKVLN